MKLVAVGAQLYGQACLQSLEAWDMVARTFKSVVVVQSIPKSPFLVYVFGVRMPLPGHCELLTRGATCCGTAAPGSRAAEETQGLKGKGSTATVDPLGQTGLFRVLGPIQGLWST